MNIGLLEFEVFAILIALMYGFSAIEILLIHHKYPKQNLMEMKKSAIWAFCGIFFTIVTGYVGKIVDNQTADIVLLLVPLFFIGQWAMWYRHSSGVPGKLDDLKVMVDDYYRDNILQVIEDINTIHPSANQVPPLSTKREILNRLRSRLLSQDRNSEDFKYGLLNEIAKLGLKTPGIDQYHVYLELFHFEEPRLDYLLVSMEKDEKIRKIWSIKEYTYKKR